MLNGNRDKQLAEKNEDESTSTQHNIEYYFIKRIVVVAFIACGILFLVELSQNNFVLSFNSYIDLLALAGLAISVTLLLRKKIIDAGMLTAISLLILMTFELIFSAYIRPGSLAVILVIGLFNSIFFNGKTKNLMHILTFGSLLAVFIYFLLFKSNISPEQSPLLTTAVNILLMYLIIAYTSNKLKNKYDNTIINIDLKNNELNTTIKELNEQKEILSKTLQELTDTQNQLIQTEKMASLGVMISGIAHEINNPLNFIQGGILGLKEQLKKDPANRNDEEISKMVNYINEGIDRSSKIVKSMSRLSPHSQRSHIQKCNLHQIIDNCLIAMSSEINGRVSINKQYQKDTINIMANESNLHQVFFNILLNSAHSIDSEGDIIIRTESDNKNGHIRTIIEDTGNGIPENVQSKIFDPFFTTKSPGMGVGLGLTTAYTIIKEHNGNISLDSSPGIGTRIEINLPG